MLRIMEPVSQILPNVGSPLACAFPDSSELCFAMLLLLTNTIAMIGISRFKCEDLLKVRVMQSIHEHEIWCLDY